MKQKILPFLRFKYVAYAVSAGLMVLFLAITVPQGGLNWGIDFVGGVKIRAQFESGVSISDVRSTLQKSGLNASVQTIGNDENNEFVISTKLIEGSENTESTYELLWNTLKTDYPAVVQLANDSVGPTIGDYLKQSAFKLVIIAVVLMMIYLAFRFEFKYALGAMIALAHDLVLAVLFCGMMNVEINVQVIAALLTIFGYSVNDTIVIFDRIRENAENETSPIFADIINIGISQSISRTLLTSLTTLFAVLSLYLLGGDTINDFAMVLLFGIFVGTYSSIYVASPVVLTYTKIMDKIKHK
ncbi:MAG: protein translocase subunit SecF [Spirochaetes bacterium]|nr:protein translocase subunit SecF [Spirochaetota bacterium]MBN2770282.1 protein translocase subunit SecF [Spirochaetota bacterium]